jgi:hypothetical protein
MTGASYPKVWQDQHGIIRIGWGRGKITLDDMHRAHRRHLSISNRPEPVLVYAECGDTMSIDWAALDYAAGPEVSTITAASALLVNSFMQQHIARLFLWYHRPPYPARIFRTEAEAINWLLPYLEDGDRADSTVDDQ